MLRGTAILGTECQCSIQRIDATSQAHDDVLVEAARNTPSNSIACLLDGFKWFVECAVTSVTAVGGHIDVSSEDGPGWHNPDKDSDYYCNCDELNLTFAHKRPFIQICLS